MKSLEVKALEESNKYKQSSHAVFTPNPGRFSLVGDTGTGKTSAAAIIFEALMPICSRFHLIAPAIHTDGSFDKFRDLIDARLKKEGVLASDPGENPYHDSMDALKDVIAQHGGTDSPPVAYSEVVQRTGGRYDSRRRMAEAPFSSLLRRGGLAPATLLLQRLQLLVERVGLREEAREDQ